MDNNINKRGLRGQMVAGVSWSMVSQVSFEGLAFIISIILARLLPPEAFGIIAMAAVFTGFSAVLNKIGLAQSLVYRQDVTEDHRSSAFWFGIINSAIIAFIVIVLAPFAGKFYHEPRVVGIMMLIAGGNIIAAFSRIPDALLRRNLDFRSLAIGKSSGTLVGGVIAVAMAFAGAGVWSLAVYPLSSGLVEASVLWIVSGWRPKFVVKRQAIKDLFGFSANLSASQIFSYWSRNADNLLAGRFLGPTALGYYARAYNLMLMPVTQVSDVIGRAVWPVLARIQNDKQKTSKIMLRSIRLIAFVTFPVMVGAFVLGDQLILAIYGAKWSAAVTSFRILCMVGLLQSITNTGIWIYQAQGRTDIMLKWNLVKGFIYIAGFILGVLGGKIEYLALSYLILTAFFFPFDILIPGRLIGLSFGLVMKPLLVTFLCAAAMGLFVWVLRNAVPKDWGIWLSLVIDITGGIILYGALVYLFRLSAWSDVLGIIRNRRLEVVG